MVTRLSEPTFTLPETKQQQGQIQFIKSLANGAAVFPDCVEVRFLSHHSNSGAAVLDVYHTRRTDEVGTGL